MAATGRLTAAQRAALAAGAPVRQTWEIVVPGDTLHLFWLTYPLDSGIFPVLGTEKRRVVRAGRRSHEVWNPSPKVSVTPKAVRYSFVVDNHDGIFYETHPDNVYQIPGLYQAKAQECRIVHRLFVAVPGAYQRSTTWSEITHMAYTGGIISVRFEDVADAAGNPVPGSATITCEQLGAWSVLRRDWTADDCVDVPLTNGAVIDYVWTVT